MKKTFRWAIFVLPIILFSIQRLLAQVTVTPTGTPTCVQFTDAFGGSTSLNNYNYYGWGASTAAALSYQVTSGELQVAPTSGAVYSWALATNSVFNQSLGDYTVQADFKLDTAAQGIFGPVFRSNGPVSECYTFEWNGLSGEWMIEKECASGNYYYLACNTGNPYTLGTWVRLMVTASGGTFDAWETPESAPGVASGAVVQVFTNVTDSVVCAGGSSALTAAYTSGDPGIRAYNIVAGNILHIQNFTAYSCLTTVPTPTSSYEGLAPPSSGDFFIYPSPARGSQATVAYNMAGSGRVELRVWNEKAELVAQVTDQKPAGVQVTPFSISGFASGVYFYSLVIVYDSGTTQKLSPRKFVILH